MPNDQHPGPGSFRRQHLVMKKLLRTRARPHPPSVRTTHEEVAATGRTGAGEAGVGGPIRAGAAGRTAADHGAGAARHRAREPGMGTVPALGEHTEPLLRAAGMTDEQGAALRRDGVIAGAARAVGSSVRDERSVRGRTYGDGPSGQWRPPKSERRSRRSGAKSETRALLLRRVCAGSREVSSSISSVASALSRCGTAGPPSTSRWRSRRELVALLPHVMAGTRGLLRIAICSMSLPTRTRAPGPGRLTLSPHYDTRVSRSSD